MKNVMDFTSSSKMLSVFCDAKSRGKCIATAYRYRGVLRDYYISNLNHHASDFLIVVVPSKQRPSFSSEKFLVVGSFLCVLQFIHSRDCVDEPLVSQIPSGGDDLPF